MQTSAFNDVISKQVINPVERGGLYPNNQACFYTIKKAREASVLQYVQLFEQDVEQDPSNNRCNDCFAYQSLFPNGGSSQYVTCGVGVDTNIHGKETPFDIEAQFRSDESVRRSGGMTEIFEYPTRV